MADKELPDISVTDFVEKLLMGEEKSILEGKAPPPDLSNTTKISKPNYVPDVSDIEVPDELVESITGKRITRTKIEEETEEVEELGSLEEKVQSIISQLTTITESVKELVNEMTTVGMIGVNMAGPAKEACGPKKKKTKKKKTKEMTEAEIIAEALKDYLK